MANERRIIKPEISLTLGDEKIKQGSQGFGIILSIMIKGSEMKLPEIIYRSKQMQKIIELIEKVAPTHVTVLIKGETGTGKELVANSIHYHSPRRERPIESINCGAFPDTLIESEFFGHVKGAFTGAIGERQGLFEVADGGTLFLDEVGDLSPIAQVKLLRVLQEGEFRRVGKSEVISTDVRIIAATNKDLQKGVKEGWFREDLFYRLNVFPISIPPLRERREDILHLAGHFLRKYAHEMGLNSIRLSREALDAVMNYKYPGNIRELQGIIQYSLIVCDKEKKTIGDLPEPVSSCQKQEMDVNSANGLKMNTLKNRIMGIGGVKNSWIKRCRLINTELILDFFMWIKDKKFRRSDLAASSNFFCET